MQTSSLCCPSLGNKYLAAATGENNFNPLSNSSVGKTNKSLDLISVTQTPMLIFVNLPRVLEALMKNCVLNGKP